MHDAATRPALRRGGAPARRDQRAEARAPRRRLSRSTGGGDRPPRRPAAGRGGRRGRRFVGAIVRERRMSPLMERGRVALPSWCCESRSLDARRRRRRRLTGVVARSTSLEMEPHPPRTSCSTRRAYGTVRGRQLREAPARWNVPLLRRRTAGRGAGADASITDRRLASRDEMFSLASESSTAGAGSGSRRAHTRLPTRFIARGSTRCAVGTNTRRATDRARRGQTTYESVGCVRRPPT